MNFNIGSADSLQINDPELSELLLRVYVDGGFVSSEIAVSLFDAAAVRSRGNIIGARERQDQIFAGMVIVVYPGSPARRLAQGNETEMHLLGVKPEYRGHGLGRALVAAAINDARLKGYSNMLLATQVTMHNAHRLYESLGFMRVTQKDYSRAGREFLAYEKVILI